VTGSAQLDRAYDFAEVEFVDVSFDYGRRRVLADVSFRSIAGSITAVLGPNGAGKTTLLSLAATRVRPSRGTVRFGSYSPWTRAHPPPDAMQVLRSRIGWLGHDPGLYPELTARENLAFFARLHGVDEEATVDRALTSAGLSDRSDEPVSRFSRGMRQRIGLERVLLHRPRFVLLDEPFTGLDEVSSDALVRRLLELRSEGCLVLLSTHDLGMVESSLDAALVLRAGRVAGWIEGSVDRRADMRRLMRGEMISPAAQVTGSALMEPAFSESSPGGGAAVVTAAREVVRHAGHDSLAPRTPVPFRSAVAAIVRKDLAVEFRSRELFVTTLFFAVTCVLVFAFAFVRQGRALADAAAGILWIAVAFSGTLALGRTFDREQANQTLPALLQAPIDRPAVYVGKLAGLLALLIVLEAALVPLIGLLFQMPLGTSRLLYLVPLLLAGTIGLLAVGTMFSAMLVRTKSRDVLLPVLLYPMTLPVMLAGVRGTALLAEAVPDMPSARAWLSMLVFFDAVFVTLALWTFEAVMTD
jgi:heme exporter protein CcmB